jgi:futalosine hydrolase
MKKHPSAIAEDMEGFSVAAACKLAGKPIRIVRGISNRAGDRDHRFWEIDRGLDAAMTRVLESTN